MNMKPNGNGTNDQLINVLCCPVGWNDPQNGASDPQNPKKIQFLSVNNAKSTTAPKGGIATVAANPGPDKAPINQGAFVDPWGDPYVVFMDNNYDNNKQGGGAYYNDWPASGLGVGVAACSLGKDGTWGSNSNGTLAGSDDIVSWQ
ncbi:MAG: hypothetical protein WCH43_00990 [Verrucomicrobiota bacterium]